MGNQSSADQGEREGDGGGGGRGREKKKSFLNCQCGKGRDDKDEIDGAGRTKGTKLTEEEWAQVKSGRMHVDRGQPDLVLEEADHSKVPSRSRLYREGAGNDSGGAEGRRTDEGAGAKVEKTNPYRSLPKSEKPQVETPERFKVGDRVKCACKKWGNQYEVGSVVKVGYREDTWPADKPDAAYQVKLDKGALIYAPQDLDDYIVAHDESWAKQLPPGSPWYLQPGALDRELAKIGAYR